MDKQKTISGEEKLTSKLRAEVKERLKDKVGEVEAIEIKIENIKMNIQEHEKMKQEAEAKTADLHEMNVAGKGGVENIDIITSFAIKIQTIDKIVDDLQESLKQIEQERDEKLEEVAEEARPIINEIRIRLQKKIDSEGNKYVERVEMLGDALLSAHRIIDYISVFENRQMTAYNRGMCSLYIPTSFLNLVICHPRAKLY